MRTPTHKLRLALLAVLLVESVVFLTSDAVVFDWLPAAEQHYRFRLGLLLQKAGMEAYWSMDEPVLREQVHHGVPISDGTSRIRGVCGHAREFLPGAGGYILTDLPWNVVGPTFTISCWLEFPNDIPDQNILQYLVIQDGKLTTAFPGQKHALEWPIHIHDQFIHVAVTVDGANGMGRMYINGKQASECKVGHVELGGHHICFGEDRWTPPVHFAIDEVSLWHSALSANAIERLSRPGRTVGGKGVGVRRLKLALCEEASDMVHSLLRVEDLFNPFLNPRQLSTSGLPTYSLLLSKRDIKAFNGFHNARVDNGLTGYKESEKRHISVLRDGALSAAQMRVIGSRKIFHCGRAKPTYLVEIEDEKHGSVTERWLFRPPEECPFLLEILAGQLAKACHYPVNAPELCTVSVNGGQDGLYLCERLQHGRSLPWLGTTNGWQQCVEHLPVADEELADAFQRLAGQYDRVLRSDRKSPLAGREMLEALQQQKALLMATIGSRSTGTTSGVADNLTTELFLGQQHSLPIVDITAAGTFGESDPAVCLVQLTETNGMVWDLPGGEIHLRGNTALVKAMKPYYEIEFEKPHGIDGLVKSKHLLLTSVYRDPAIMRDRLAYDLFRSFSAPGKPRYTPHARFVEVVVNGDYMGVYEMTDRIDAELLGFGDTAVDPAHPAVLYKAMDASATFERRNPGAYVQKVPHWKDGATWGPYNEFMDFISQSDSNTFAREVEQRIDVDNIIDFELFLGVAQNGEGRNYNLFIARRGGAGEKFFLVPWDYDMSFWGEIKANNYLIDRLHQDLPGYMDRLKARWKELRAGPLTDDHVMARIDELHAELAGGPADRNFRRWPYPDYPYEANVEFIRTWLSRRLATMDLNLGISNGQ